MRSALRTCGVDTHCRPADRRAGHSPRHALNYGPTLDDPAGKARGLRFTPQNNGSGLYCVPGADKDPGRIGALCRDFQPEPPIPATLQSQIAASCSK